MSHIRGVLSSPSTPSLGPRMRETLGHSTLGSGPEDYGSDLKKGTISYKVRFNKTFLPRFTPSPRSEVQSQLRV